MKGITSKIVVMCLSGALMIGAALLPERGGDVPVGAGNGKNAELTSIDDVSDLLKSFRDQLTGYHAPNSENKNLSFPTNRLAAASDDPQEEQEKENKASYWSVTVHESSSYNISYSTNLSYTYSGTSYRMNSSSSIKGKREMSVYISEDAVYYVIDFTIMADSSQDDGKEQESHNSYASILMKIYMSENEVLFRMDRFSAIHDGEAVTGTSKFLGQWIDMTASGDLGVQEAIEALTSVNDGNFDVLALMGEYIENNKDAFDEKDSVFTMKETMFKSFLAALLSAQGVGGTLDDDVDGAFSVDLYDAEKPRIYLNFGNSYADHNTNGSVSSSSGQTDDFILCNINNTVVGKPDVKDALSPEEFEKLIEEVMAE